MEAVQEQKTIKGRDGETPVTSNANKSHNPGLRALLAIKNFTATLEKDYADLQEIESNMHKLNKESLMMMEANASAEPTAQWKEDILNLDNAVTDINTTLTAAKEKIEQNVKEGFPNLWIQLAVQLTALTNQSNIAANTGIDLLPESLHAQWQKEFVEPGNLLLQSMVTHVESCRVLLQMIERYTPHELDAITKIIVDQIPLDFTYEEAVAYQNDYYKALVNFKKEFQQKKNLWDKFLDILAGGTHQPPSERVMMERWLDGEKGEL